MRIVDHHTFCRMPAGTVFATYKPCVAGELQVKTDTGHPHPMWYDKDFWTFNGVMDVQPMIKEGFEPGPVDSKVFLYDGAACDYDKDELFVIYEPEDIRTMIDILNYALGGCKDTKFEEKYL